MVPRCVTTTLAKCHRTRQNKSCAGSGGIMRSCWVDQRAQVRLQTKCCVVLVGKEGQKPLSEHLRREARWSVAIGAESVSWRAETKERRNGRSMSVERSRVQRRRLVHSASVESCPTLYKHLSSPTMTTVGSIYERCGTLRSACLERHPTVQQLFGNVRVAAEACECERGRVLLITCVEGCSTICKERYNLMMALQ